MAKALYFPHPFDLTERTVLEVQDGITIAQFLERSGHDRTLRERPTVVMLNQQELLEEDYNTVLQHSDIVALQSLPEGGFLVAAAQFALEHWFALSLFAVSTALTLYGMQETSVDESKDAQEPDADLPRVQARLSSYGLAPVEGTVRAGSGRGVGVLPILGPVWHAARWGALAQDFAALDADPEIEAIVLDIDSPGGILAGVQGLAEMVYQARERKPITAFIGGLGASAAYWLASAASEVVISESGQAGSIGVRGNYVDDSGVQTRRVSSQSPAKHRFLFDQGIDEVQTRVDAMAAVFVDAVARNRGVSRETVLSRFGGGDVIIGKHAVEAGLADRLGTVEDLLSPAGIVVKHSRGQ